MKKFFLIKTFFVLTIIFGLSSCKSIIVRLGAFHSIGNYAEEAGDLLLKTWKPSLVGLEETTEENEVAVITGGDNEKPAFTEASFFIPGEKSYSQQDGRWLLKDEGARKKTPETIVKQPWIICKPQFIRVRSETALPERNRTETMF